MIWTPGISLRMSRYSWPTGIDWTCSEEMPLLSSVEFRWTTGTTCAVTVTVSASPCILRETSTTVSCASWTRTCLVKVLMPDSSNFTV